VLAVLVSGHAQDARLEESPDGITRKGRERLISGQRVATGAERAADCAGEFGLLDGTAYRTEIRSGEIGVGHGSSSMTGWEESGRLHLARTIPNLSQPS